MERVKRMDNKELLNKLGGLEDHEIEKVAEEFPPLSDEDKSRIIQKCLDKTTDTDGAEGETVSGTEIYSRPKWYKFAATAAAIAIAAIGICGTVYLTRNMSDPSASDKQNQSTSAQGAAVSSYTITEHVKENEKTNTAVVTSAPVTTTTATEKPYVAYTTETSSTSSETTSSTTETTTETDVTTIDPLNTETTAAATEPATETHTETVTVKLPVGYWKSEEDGRERYWLFYHDGSGGKFHFAETGTGLSFTVDAEEDHAVFHFGSADESTKARITWYNSESFAIDWEETNSHELFEADPDEKIED